MIWRSFRENGIEIPFPQREVRLIGSPPAATPPAAG
jgi:small-conductance mechanosensitive channel